MRQRGSSTAASTVGNQLTIYSSLPLQGPSAAISQQIVNGEKLALAERRGRSAASRSATTRWMTRVPTTGEWDPGVTATNAKIAAQDTSTIAYLGDYNSGATAISLPLINAAGILQVSPASPYVGLTSSLDAGQDEPERFYSTGKRKFVRLVPGDQVEAAPRWRSCAKGSIACTCCPTEPLRRAAGTNRGRETPPTRESKCAARTSS